MEKIQIDNEAVIEDIEKLYGTIDGWVLDSGNTNIPLPHIPVNYKWFTKEERQLLNELMSYFNTLNIKYDRKEFKELINYKIENGMEDHPFNTTIVKFIVLILCHIELVSYEECPEWAKFNHYGLPVDPGVKIASKTEKILYASYMKQKGFSVLTRSDMFMLKALLTDVNEATIHLSKDTTGEEMLEYISIIDSMNFTLVKYTNLNDLINLKLVKSTLIATEQEKQNNKILVEVCQVISIRLQEGGIDFNTTVPNSKINDETVRFVKRFFIICVGGFNKVEYSLRVINDLEVEQTVFNMRPSGTVNKYFENKDNTFETLTGSIYGYTRIKTISRINVQRVIDKLNDSSKIGLESFNIITPKLTNEEHREILDISFSLGYGTVSKYRMIDRIDSRRYIFNKFVKNTLNILTGKLKKCIQEAPKSSEIHIESDLLNKDDYAELTTHTKSIGFKTSLPPVLGDVNTITNRMYIFTRIEEVNKYYDFLKERTEGLVLKYGQVLSIRIAELTIAKGNPLPKDGFDAYCKEQGWECRIHGDNLDIRMLVTPDKLKEEINRLKWSIFKVSTNVEDIGYNDKHNMLVILNSELIRLKKSSKTEDIKKYPDLDLSNMTFPIDSPSLVRDVSAYIKDQNNIGKEINVTRPLGNVRLAAINNIARSYGLELLPITERTFLISRPSGILILDTRLPNLFNNIKRYIRTKLALKLDVFNIAFSEKLTVSQGNTLFDICSEYNIVVNGKATSDRVYELHVVTPK